MLGVVDWRVPWREAEGWSTLGGHVPHHSTWLVVGTAPAPVHVEQRAVLPVPLKCRAIFPIRQW